MSKSRLNYQNTKSFTSQSNNLNNCLDTVKIDKVNYSLDNYISKLTPTKIGISNQSDNIKVILDFIKAKIETIESNISTLVESVSTPSPDSLQTKDSNTKI